MILPIKEQGTFTKVKGRTLGAFSYYFMCQGQQQAETLHYSPLPINLVKAGLEQIRRIPGVVAKNIDIKKCNNPTFSASGRNKLAETAPYPKACDKQGSAPCSTGSGGAKGGGSSGGGSTGGTTTGGTTTGGTTGGTGGTGGTTPSVDPDTGQTVAADGSTSGGTTSGTGTTGTVALAQPVTVAGSSGWGGAQTLMLLAGIAVLALVLLPSFVSRLLARRSR
jgi:phosphate transport system substrate-binding protein